MLHCKNRLIMKENQRKRLTGPLKAFTLKAFPIKKGESVLFLTSNKHSGDFVRDMIGRA